MESTTGKRKGKKIFQTKKYFITCSKLIINKIGRCPTRSDNVYFANNEQVSLAVFTAAFCFAHAKHNLIKLNYIITNQRKLLTVFGRALCEIQANQSNSSPLKISQSINVE